MINRWLSRLRATTYRWLLFVVFVVVYMAMSIWTLKALSAGAYWSVIAVLVLASVMLGILLRRATRP